MEMHQVLNEGSDFHEYNSFVTDGSFTADGGPIVTDGECKHNTSNDPFSRSKSVQ